MSSTPRQRSLHLTHHGITEAYDIGGMFAGSSVPAFFLAYTAFLMCMGLLVTATLFVNHRAAFMLFYLFVFLLSAFILLFYEHRSLVKKHRTVISLVIESMRILDGEARRHMIDDFERVTKELSPEDLFYLFGHELGRYRRLAEESDVSG